MHHERIGDIVRAGVLAGALCAAVAMSGGALAAMAGDAGTGAVVVAQAHGTEPAPLEPRYQPVPPEEKGWYSTAYFFAMTRGVARSTLVPALKAPLFLLTVPGDVALLPFAAIGGLFG